MERAGTRALSLSITRRPSWPVAPVMAIVMNASSGLMSVRLRCTARRSPGRSEFHAIPPSLLGAVERPVGGLHDLVREDRSARLGRADAHRHGERTVPRA